MRDFTGSWKQVRDHQCSFLGIFIGVLGIAVLRVFAEFFCFFSFDIAVWGQSETRFLLENVYYFLVLFLVATVFISWLTRISLQQVMNFALRLYPVIILPPLIDGFLFQQQDGYSYATLGNMGWNFLTLSFLKGDASLGISIEILLGLIGIFWYVLVQTKSVWKAIVAAVFIDSFLVLLSTPELFFGENADYRFDPFLPLYYFFPFLVLILGVAAGYAKEKVLKGLGNLRLERAVIFVIVAWLGGYTQYLDGNGWNTWNLFLAGAALFFVWEVSVMLNDISDREIDVVSNPARPLARGVVTVFDYYFMSVIASFLALSCAALINGYVFLLMVVSLVLAVVYSIEPIRLRKNWSGNVLIGASILLAFYAGLFSNGRPDVISQKAIIFSAMVFLYGTVVSLAKDVKDITGDARNGIRNLFTIWGEQRARVILCAIIFILLSVPAAVFLDPVLLILNCVVVGWYYRSSSIIAIYAGSTINTFLVFRHLYHS